MLDSHRALIDARVRPALLQAAALGFLGRAPVDDQIDHALGFVSVLEGVVGSHPTSAVDLGSGGGLPGLVLACCWPETRVVLIDSNHRRTRFLREVTDSWAGARQIEVVRERTEVLGRQAPLREHFEVVTSRSFGAPAVTAENGSPFLSIEGWLIVSEPPDAVPGDRWPPEGLAKLGLSPVSATRESDRFGYQLLQKVRPLSDRYPRHVGIPAKRPLF